jgi:hypothetical protein
MRKQVMGLIVALAIALPVSTVIAAPKSPKLARCDGHHRRTANPYGSILPTVDPQTGASTPAGQTQGNAGVDVFPGKSQAPSKPATPAGRGGKPEPAVPPISSAQPLRTYQSC